MIFLAPGDRPAAFAGLARVVTPGGHLVTAFKAGDDRLRRAGRSTGLGVEFDQYRLRPDRLRHGLADAGFAPVFWAGRPAETDETSAQGYLIARRVSGVAPPAPAARG